MADSTIALESTEELTEDSKVILDASEVIRTNIQTLRDVKESLSFWQSSEKEKAFANLDAMIADLEDLLTMAESYGAVGVQTAATTEAAEAEVKGLNNKFADYLA